MEQFVAKSAGLGRDHPLARRQWLIVVTMAQKWYLGEMAATAEEVNLLPEDYGCDDNGRRLFALDDIAAKLGVSEEDMMSSPA